MTSYLPQLISTKVFKCPNPHCRTTHDTDYKYCPDCGTQRKDNNPDLAKVPPGPPLNIVVIGKTGQGKSSTGNSILFQDAFNDSCSSSSVTKACEWKTVTIDNRELLVVDTPGYLDTSFENPLNVQESLKFTSDEVARGLTVLNDSIHAVLLVMKFGERCIAYDRAVILAAEELFGGALMDYGIICFSHKDEMERQEKRNKTNKEEHLKQLRSQSIFRDILDKCGNRVVYFNNLAASEVEQKAQLVTLIKLIDITLTKKNFVPFTTGKLEEAREIVRQKREKEMAEAEERKLKVEEKRKEVDEIMEKQKIFDEEKTTEAKTKRKMSLMRAVKERNERIKEEGKTRKFTLRRKKSSKAPKLNELPEDDKQLAEDNKTDTVENGTTDIVENGRTDNVENGETNEEYGEEASESKLREENQNTSEKENAVLVEMSNLIQERMISVEEKFTQWSENEQEKKQPNVKENSKDEQMFKLDGELEDMGCFSCDSKVILKNWNFIPVKDLQVGDTVLSVKSDGKLIFDEVFIITHMVSRKIEALKISTDRGRSITLTANHMMLINGGLGFDSMLPARNIQSGHFIMVLNSNQELQIEMVTAVELVMVDGCVCPTTASGRIIVDSVVVSCYPDDFPPFLQHYTLYAPMKVLHWILPNVFKTGKQKHGMPKWIWWLKKCVHPTWNRIKSFY
ncbi:uncharacterized protein LOC117119324 [Anneissia japonica]|uniref:uncharacterized protein LOC117119324 n=1 Tax=Anneissia japonica TaxID=1529436 RepID=UPI001425A6E0|nr:uncharacterized protein LOC117119324 [Anneissia japonica]